MSLPQLQAFIKHIHAQDNPQLNQDLKRAAAAQDLSAVVAIAMQAGFAVDEGDIQEFHAQQVIELSDADLDQASGGEATGWLAAGEEERPKVIVINESLHDL
jgi:predicted ribosomally synthesized peptide with nif11-like leader